MSGGAAAAASATARCRDGPTSHLSSLLSFSFPSHPTPPSSPPLVTPPLPRRRIHSPYSRNCDAGLPLRRIRADSLPWRGPAAGFASISAPSSSSAGGGGGRFSAGGGGRGGGDDSSAGAAAAAGAVAALGEAKPADGGPDAIVLHIGGMSCGGCAAKVKRILENQEHCSTCKGF